METIIRDRPFSNDRLQKFWVGTFDPFLLLLFSEHGHSTPSNVRTRMLHYNPQE